MKTNKGRIIAIANQKGGVGKTTTAINLSASLGILEKKVLLIDSDPQANVAIGLGIEDVQNDLYGFLKGLELKDCLFKNVYDCFDFLPSTINLAKLELADSGIANKELFMTKISPLKEQYDYIIIDCPPSLGNILVSILSFCDSIIVPVQCEVFAFHGLRKILKTFKTISSVNPKIDIEGILVSMHNKMINEHKFILDSILEYFESITFKTIIPQNISLAEAASKGLPVIKYNASSTGAIKYLELAAEIISKNNNKIIVPDLIKHIDKYNHENEDLIEDLNFILEISQPKTSVKDINNNDENNYTSLEGITKIDVKARFGLNFNDIKSDVWMYRICPKFNFFNKNYLHIIFKNDKVLFHRLKRLKVNPNDYQDYFKL